MKEKITLVDLEGNERTCDVVSVFTYGDSRFIIYRNLKTDKDLTLSKVIEKNGNYILENISDEEFERVNKYAEELLGDIEDD